MRLIILAMMLTGCVLEYTPDHAYYCPYPMSEVRKAEKYVTSVVRVPWKVMGPSHFGYVEKDGTVHIRADFKGQGYEDIYWHEVCHLWDYHYAGTPWAELHKHKRWIPFSARANRW